MQGNVKYQRKQRPLKTCFESDKNKKNEYLMCKSVKLRKNYELSSFRIKKIITESLEQQRNYKINSISTSFMKGNMINTCKFRIYSTKSCEKQTVKNLRIDQNHIHFNETTQKSLKIIDVGIAPQIIVQKCHLIPKMQKSIKRLHYLPIRQQIKKINKKANFFKQIMHKIKAQSLGFTITTVTQPKSISKSPILQHQIQFQKSVKFKPNINRKIQQSFRKPNIFAIESGRLGAWEITNNNTGDFVQY